ncbi:MAG: 2-dehydro-3-deoxygalactonokinase, partial [Selenomonadaceae bacterium]|nr:2-dehydro-3-deoxygalactonokinase [Selenomonadaceae bacterium]
MFFIRGLRTNGSSLYDTDIMRGEETEMAGIMDDASAGACTYILPGSHSKVIYTDDQGRITDFFTAMTGEMLASLSGYTILKNSVNLANSSLDESKLLAGYEYCAAEGLNKALFKVRICDTMLKMDSSARYSFFLGAVLCGEITAILKQAAGKIVVGGKHQLRDALCILLKHASDLEIVCLPQEK